MIRVGVTGTLGAGKSSVGRLFEAWSAFRIDADALARQAVRPGTAAFERIRRDWGDAVIGENGSLDRGALRRIVAADAAARRRLERIIHPEVGRLRELRRLEAARQGARVVVEEVPLLFEVGLEDEFDLLVVVDAPQEVRRRRVREKRRLSSAEFAAMEAAQLPGEKKRAAADLVVWNDGDREDLERKARHVWDRILAGGKAEVPGPDRFWTADLHMHTGASHDCLSDPADVVRTARARGLDRIAITDHNEIDGALAARELDSELVIVGEEVRTAEGPELIGLFLEQRIPPGGTLAEVADAVHAQGGVVYLPHPFDARRGADEAQLDAIAGRIDLVEGFNARIHDPERNRRAVAWATRHGLPVAAGSDAHLLVEIGRAWVRLPPFDGPRGLVASARRGALEGTASAWWVHLGSSWAKLRKRLPV